MPKEVDSRRFRPTVNLQILNTRDVISATRDHLIKQNKTPEADLLEE